MFKSQAAVEYLTTYGWAILIIAIVIAALYSVGLFNPTALIGNTCAFPADFSCLAATLFPSGNFVVNIQQATAAAINVTAIGCNSDSSTSNMIQFGGPARIYIPIGGNSSFTMLCYSNGVPYNSPFPSNTVPLGTLFKGYIVVNYTNLQTGFPHTVIGRLIQKVA